MISVFITDIVLHRLEFVKQSYYLCYLYVLKVHFIIDKFSVIANSFPLKCSISFLSTWYNNSANLPYKITVCESKCEDRVSSPSVWWSKSNNSCCYFDKLLSILAVILTIINETNLIEFALSITFLMNFPISNFVCITFCVNILSFLLLFTICL